MQAQGHPTQPHSTDPRSEDFVQAFGARLLERGLIDELALGRARRAQAQARERFDYVLSRLGLVPEAQLTALLAEYLAIPRATPAHFEAASGLAVRLPIAFVKTNRALPLSDTGDGVLVATADPFNTEAIAAISFLLGRPAEPLVATPAEIDQAIARRYGSGAPGAPPGSAGSIGAAPLPEEASEDDVRRLEDMASEAPVIRLVHDLIQRAVEHGASDIHIEPREDCVRVRFRVDGQLETVETLPQSVRLALSSRVKIMAQLNIAERRLPQDGRIKANVRGREIDLRVSTMPSMCGESVVLRILDRSSLALDFTTLGFGGRDLTILQSMLVEPNGIVLVTGPTGSGKTTTLYAALTTLNAEELKLFTVEDPVEYQIAGINQVQVSPKIGLTFSSALRSILRQDPDIIMVGEIRDLETASIAIRASLTGHLVLSTVHTNSAAATVTRLIDMGVEDYLLASTLKGVLAQRLVRRLCPACAKPANLAPALAERLFAGGSSGGTKIDVRGVKVACGCPECRGTGFQGRTVIYELLSMTDSVRAAILGKEAEGAIHAAAVAAGMTPMLDTGLAKVLAGETTLEEVLRVTRTGDAAL